MTGTNRFPPFPSICMKNDMLSPSSNGAYTGMRTVVYTHVEMVIKKYNFSVLAKKKKS